MIKRILKQFVKLPLQVIRRHTAKNSLLQLTTHEDPKIKAIGHALLEALVKDLSAEELDAIHLIEQRHSFLLKSTRDIYVIDYGAGSPVSKRTEEEMKRGIQSAERVADIAEASLPKFRAVILFKILRKLKPVSCVELGAGAGISAAYLASALNINGKGTVVTLEGSPEIANIAKETLESLGIVNATVITGPFHKTLNDVLTASNPVDFVLNDGHHDHNAVIHYFNQVVPFLSDDAVIVLDDISWSAGMKKAWSRIEEDERVSASINLHSLGIAIVKKSLTTKVKYKIPL
jgi:predicted O-methyltransferase YrrM